jgi:acyl-CoA dehydrogenase
MGYIEETGACQYLRDARISTIYEGTTGIQAADLVGRKLATDQGAAMAELIAEMRELALELERSTDRRLFPVGAAVATGVQALEDATGWMLRALAKDVDEALASSFDYLMLTGYVCGGWQMARAALAASRKCAAGEDPAFHEAKIATVRFYADKILPKANSHVEMIRSGASGASDIAIEQF